jgi:hypothetical protein
LAEREGFEPSLGLTLNTLSRRAPSATQPPLQIFVLFAVNANGEILPRHLPEARVQFILSGRILGKASVLIKMLREKTR